MTHLDRGVSAFSPLPPGLSSSSSPFLLLPLGLPGVCGVCTVVRVECVSEVREMMLECVDKDCDVDFLS
ncbi:hypothetical protein Scep_025011 [Stephania cephalantha]|uniref:Uncharacterized protein n=1 Tax=Stephania cephalantha TaxID=152367 RepID=A0AAP0HYS4_9MAGN